MGYRLLFLAALALLVHELEQCSIFRNFGWKITPNGENIFIPKTRKNGINSSLKFFYRIQTVNSQITYALTVDKSTSFSFRSCQDEHPTRNPDSCSINPTLSTWACCSLKGIEYDEKVWYCIVKCTRYFMLAMSCFNSIINMLMYNAMMHAAYCYEWYNTLLTNEWI